MLEIDEVRQLIDNLKYPLEYEDQDWGKYPKADCYTYALGLPLNQGYLIGDFIGNRMTHGDSIEDIISTFKDEMEALGFWVFECETDDNVEDNCLKLYIEFDECNNYHLLRENADGTWSHKSANSLPNQTDISGKWIFDPESMSQAMNDKAGFCFIICSTNFV